MFGNNIANYFHFAVGDIVVGEDVAMVVDRVDAIADRV